MDYSDQASIWIRSPLAKKTLSQMGVRIAIVITIAALVSYFHIFSLLDKQVHNSLAKYIAERGAKESAIFVHAERNHAKFKKTFLELWPEFKGAQLDDEFERFFARQADGTLRLKPFVFDGYTRSDDSISRHITGYVGSNAEITTELQNRLLLSYRLIDRFADAWAMDYANLYVAMPENVNLVYWPGVPWGLQALSDLDVTTEEWVTVANRQNNPTREPVWTGLYFDPTANEWMVSLETPVDYEGQHLINIGHDILLNTLFDRVFKDKLDGAYNFIFREDGRIIAHPDFVDQLREQKGVLRAQEVGSLELVRTIDSITNNAQNGIERGVILDAVHMDALLAVTKIKGPDWYFVTVYPKNLLAATAMQTAYIVSIVGFISLIVELVILFFVLQRQVIMPVRDFANFSKGMRDYDFEQIKALKASSTHKRSDEMGQLARLMVDMANTIQQHDEHLERQVAERTSALDKTNQVLKIETAERAEMVKLLQTIAKDVSGLHGLNFFNTLTEFLAHALDADFVFISKVSEDKETIYTLSVNQGKQVVDNLSYKVANTPCEIVITEGPKVYNGNVQVLFPEDQDLVDMDIHAYIGSPMYSSQGEVIGHLAVMKQSCFENVDKVRMIVDSVSVRAACELERQFNEALIMTQAQTDALTGLANRTLFMDRLTQAINIAKRTHEHLAVLFIDFDNFKLVNDQLGHQMGDQYLKTVAQRILGCVRDEDTVARIGGDEFVVLLSNMSDLHCPEVVARKIQDALRQEITLDNSRLVTSCSMGIALYPEDSKDKDQLITHADTAMYQAKQKGRNNFQYFETSMNVEMEKSRMIEHDLRLAISRNEFDVYYQPIIDLKTNEVLKLEALVRWHHPEKGLISPDDFIPVSEITGQIIEIGQFVLNKACSDFSVFKNTFPFMESIAVNFSAKQFLDRHCAERVTDILKSHGLSHDSIEIEITESLFIDKKDRDTFETLENLKALGFKASLDDFGTGYSSLSYLKEMPIDTLKIDRCFVQDIDTDENSRVLVSSIIKIAQSFQLLVVAEGVETAKQQAFLIEQGCDLAQGYYYSRPMAQQDLIAAFDNQSVSKVD